MGMSDDISLDEFKDMLVHAKVKAMVYTSDMVNVVRCRDCKHRPTDNRDRDNDMTGFAIQFPDGKCPCQCEDGWYNWYPGDDWFCANGERREDKT